MHAGIVPAMSRRRLEDISTIDVFPLSLFARFCFFSDNDCVVLRTVPFRIPTISRLDDAVLTLNRTIAIAFCAIPAL